MAYMSQEKKKALAPKIKQVLSKYGIKGTLSVRYHSTLVMTIKSGEIDFIAQYNDAEPKCGTADGYISVNEYHFDYWAKSSTLDFLNDLKSAMNVGNHDNSDLMSDYFDVGWYIDINIGKWDKPYVYTPAQAKAA